MRFSQGFSQQVGNDEKVQGPMLDGSSGSVAQSLCPRRNPDMKTTLLPDGHVVLFNAKTDWAQTLNPMAGLVWEFSDGEHTTEDITTAITRLINTPDPAQLKQDIETWITQALDDGLLLIESQT